MYRYRKERLNIVFSFLQNLRHFQDEKKEKINLYDNNYSFIDEFKTQCKLYIDQDDTKEIKNVEGKLYFQEIDKDIDYCLPGKTDTKPFFVFRFSLN